MGRIGKTNRVPKTRNNNQWTEAAFFGFLRSGLRKMSQRWPPLVQHALKAVRRPSQSTTNKLLKWEFQCAFCLGWWARKLVQVDHIIPCGKFTCFEQLADYARRLFCETGDLRILCKDCHKKRTEIEMLELKIKSDGEKLSMFLEVSIAMQRARGLPIDVRIDLLVDYLKRNPQDLPVFLRWIWNSACRSNITWKELKQDCYMPVRGRDEPLGFWLMMSRIRRRGASLEEKQLSIREWKDSLCYFDSEHAQAAAAVIRQKAGWGLHLVHINSALMLAGLTNQCLIEAEDPSDFMER